MGKSYSADLRDRIVAYVGSGHSRRAAARQFKVSASCAVKVLQRVSRHGSSAPARQGRPLGSGKLAGYTDFLIGQVKAKPDITMRELAARLEAEHGVQSAPSSLSRLLLRSGFTFKKNAAGLGSRTPCRPTEAPRLDWLPATADAP
jgi:transposase